MTERKKLYLIDVSGYYYRAFFALPPLSTSEGLPTNAIYGFTTMLQKLLKEQKPDYLAAVLDCPEPTFRHEVYQDYKAHRPKMPDELSAQIPHMKDVITAFSIASVAKPGFEADDVIGTMARQAEAAGLDVVIISGDKDMCQLVSDRITLLDTMRGTVTGADAVQEKYGVPPEKIIEIFSLMGDKSDNVPGVPGIGEKTAAELIKAYGTLDGVYANLDAITKKKAKEALAANREKAYLSRQLVTIDTAVPLDISWSDCKLPQPDEEALRGLYKKFEFKKLLESVAAAPLSTKNYHMITSAADIDALIARLLSCPAFALDFETNSIDPMRADIVGISFSVQDHEAYYIPVGHQGLFGQPDLSWLLSKLKPLLEDKAPKKVGHNIKYEYIIFKRYGIELRGIACDTMVASYVINPSKYRHNLDDVALDQLDHRMISFKDVAGSGKSMITFDQVPIDKAVEYACEDSDITLMLAAKLLPQLKTADAEKLFYDLEMPLVTVLAQMEMTGVKIDTLHLGELSAEFGKELDGIEKKIYETAGCQFNINSPKQLGEVLFEKLGLPVQKKTKTGYATDVETLNELGHLHPLPGQVLAYRSIAKLKSTYIDNMPDLVNPATGRIHTSYNQTVTATGRLSSSEPNLQNIPIRTDEGCRIREAFVSDPGWKILSADYSQIELRILAHMSGDKTLCDSFRRDEDIHTRTASAILGVTPELVTPTMRRDAKVINFGIIYGMSSFGLSKALGIDGRTAQAYIDDYFRKYRGVRDYLDGVLEAARKDGYVTTLMNRRRYLPEITASNGAVRKFAERTAINAPIQGTAADLIKMAMLHIGPALERERLQARMIMQVHDELVFEAPEAEMDKLAALVRTVMEGVMELSVPLKVDVNWGNNWREAH
jgi:DNA polymerase-1